MWEEIRPLGDAKKRIVPILPCTISMPASHAFGTNNGILSVCLGLTIYGYSAYYLISDSLSISALWNHESGSDNID